MNRLIFNHKTFSEFLVKKGLPLILSLILIGIIISVIIIKLIRKKNYFDYVTEKLIELFDSERFTIIQINKDKKSIESVNQKFINPECYNIKIDPTSVFIQMPYFTRFLSYVLFWGYFSIQTLFMKEIFTDTDQSLDDNDFVCYNISTRLVKALYRCERFGLKSIDEIFDSMDQIAGVLALYELNQISFRFSFKFYKWLLLKKFFAKYCTRLRSQYLENKIPIVSLSQINYIFIMSLITYSIYDNFVTEKYYIPVKLVCYSILIYASILSAFETVKYLISQDGLKESYGPVLAEFNEENTIVKREEIIVNQTDSQGLLCE